jgi:hypothetical protein
MSSERRYLVEPDPAWDWFEDRDGVLTVELSWPPDALAGRGDDIVADPILVRALQGAGITGFHTAPAAGRYREDSFGVDASTPPPALVRLHVDGDDAADVRYHPTDGLVVTERALAVLRTYCTGLQAVPFTGE